MHKNTFSQGADQDELRERPQSKKAGDKGKNRYGRPAKGLCHEASKAGEQQPRKKDKGDGDLIAVELRQELPHGHQLDRNGRNTGPYDRPQDEYFQMPFHAGVLLRKSVPEMISLGRLLGLALRIILLQKPEPGTCGPQEGHGATHLLPDRL